MNAHVQTERVIVHGYIPTGCQAGSRKGRNKSVEKANENLISVNKAYEHCHVASSINHFLLSVLRKVRR